MAVPPSFCVQLHEECSDNVFNTSNPPHDPIEREEWFYEPGTLQMFCDCLNVVHGRVGPGSEEFATLIILEFRFDARKGARRISEARVEFQFSGAARPVVTHIAPDGCLSLLPSTVPYDETTEVSGTLGAPRSLVDANGTVRWVRSTQRVVTAASSVIGHRVITGRTWGPKNCAQWTFLENDLQQSGIPNAMTAAVLLTRTSNAPFQCLVNVRAKVDFKSRLERLLGMTPKHQPVLFDPSRKPKNKPRSYDADCLGDVKLEELADITFNTVYLTARKEIA